MRWRSRGGVRVSARPVQIGGRTVRVKALGWRRCPGSSRGTGGARGTVCEVCVRPSQVWKPLDAGRGARGRSVARVALTGLCAGSACGRARVGGRTMRVRALAQRRGQGSSCGAGRAHGTACEVHATGPGSSGSGRSGGAGVQDRPAVRVVFAGRCAGSERPGWVGGRLVRVGVLAQRRYSRLPRSASRAHGTTCEVRTTSPGPEAAQFGSRHSHSAGIQDCPAARVALTGRRARFVRPVQVRKPHNSGQGTRAAPVFRIVLRREWRSRGGVRVCLTGLDWGPLGVRVVLEHRRAVWWGGAHGVGSRGGGAGAVGSPAPVGQPRVG